ncbi:quinolinate synthase NadA [Puniceicoccaceae bacterium K14]|nr:quinolinate synthase NadA [Puniceicoccaceae bacterium K14]
MVTANTSAQFSETEVREEAERLLKRLMHIECDSRRSWNLESCLEIAPLTLEINQLKKETGSVVLAHSYVEPEIIYGVADFSGDSYMLSVKAKESQANRIVFSGVVFMAETAKILSPEAEVVVPDHRSGCSLADSLTGEQLREMKKLYPDAAVVCYINSTADVKSECDVCVTSSNVYKIIASLPQKQILFVPDRLMAENIRIEMKKRGIEKDIVSSDGTCIVHDQFDSNLIAEARDKFPGLKVVSHPECTRTITEKSDYVGSTGGMMQYVKGTEAPYFMMLTECGLVERIEVEAPEKRFISGCKLCPYMKMNSLEKIRDVLIQPRPDQVVELNEELRLKALSSIDRMFELAEGQTHQPSKGC